MRAGWIVVIAITMGSVGCNDDGSCGGSIETYCGGGTNCPLTWTAAHDPTAWAATADTCNEETDAVALSTCSDVLVATVKHTDTHDDYYFDRTSGELYRVDHSVLFTHSTGCEVGNGAATACNDPNPVYLCVPPPTP